VKLRYGAVPWRKVRKKMDFNRAFALIYEAENVLHDLQEKCNDFEKQVNKYGVAYDETCDERDAPKSKCEDQKNEIFLLTKRLSMMQPAESDEVKALKAELKKKDEIINNYETEWIRCEIIRERDAARKEVAELKEQIAELQKPLLSVLDPYMFRTEEVTCKDGEDE
jgi:chromosome segregation ATPase